MWLRILCFWYFHSKTVVSWQHWTSYLSSFKGTPFITRIFSSLALMLFLPCVVHHMELFLEERKKFWKEPFEWILSWKTMFPKNLLKIENFGDFLILTYYCISLVRRKKYYFCLQNHNDIHVSFRFCWYEDMSLTKSVPQNISLTNLLTCETETICHEQTLKSFTTFFS